MIGESSAERQPAAVNSRFHGADLDFHDRRDFGVVVALDIEKDDAVALFERQGRQGRGKHLRPLGRQRLRLGLDFALGRRLPGVVLEFRVGLARPAAFRPLEIHRRVDGDPAQPAANAAAAKRGQVPVRAEERLLDCIGGLVAVRDEAIHEREEVVLVANHELVERLQPATEGLFHQRDVNSLAGRLVTRFLASLRVGHASPATHSQIHDGFASCRRADRPRRREDSTRQDPNTVTYDRRGVGPRRGATGDCRCSLTLSVHLLSDSVSACLLGALGPGLRQGCSGRGG